MPGQPLCVQCRQRPVDTQWRPFCSRRCKMVDLGRWLSEEFRVADRPAGDGESEARTEDLDEHDGHD